MDIGMDRVWTSLCGHVPGIQRYARSIARNPADVDDLVQQFERHVPPGRVVVLPYDKHIAAGTEIQLDLLSNEFRRRIVELAAALSDDFDRLERR